MLSEWLIILLLKAGAFGMAWKVYRFWSHEKASEDIESGEN